MKRTGAIALLLSMGMVLTACGADEGTVGKLEGVPMDADQTTVVAEAPAETPEEGKEPAGEVPADTSDEPQEPADTPTDDRITEEQALEAIRDYCYAQNPDLEGIVEAGEYPVYWEAVSEDDTQIIILYRSYTGVLVRYYIDPVTGDTYVTEYVPGITDEEEQTEETFNLRETMAE